MKVIETLRLKKIRSNHDEDYYIRGSKYKEYWDDVNDMSKDYEYVKPEHQKG